MRLEQLFCIVYSVLVGLGMLVVLFYMNMLFTRYKERTMALVGIPPTCRLSATLGSRRYKTPGSCSDLANKVSVTSGTSYPQSSILSTYLATNSPSFFSTSASLA